MRMHAFRRGRMVVPILALLFLVSFAALSTGCGHRHYREGFILVDNRTDLTTVEMLTAFRVARFGEPFTGDVLGGDLPAGDARNLGLWSRDYYDAEADLELGQLVEWFDVFVGNRDTSVFEAR